MIRETPGARNSCYQAGSECTDGERVYAGSRLVRGLCRERDNSRIYVPGTNHEYTAYHCPPGWSFMGMAGNDTTCSHDEDHRWAYLGQAWILSEIKSPEPYGTSYFDCEHFYVLSPEGKLCKELAQALRENTEATVDQYYTLSQTLAWLHKNQSAIGIIGSIYGIPCQLVAGIIASEMAWDYAGIDAILNSLGIYNGIPSVHPGTYREAVNYADNLDPINQPSVVPSYDLVGGQTTDEGGIRMAGFMSWYLVKRYNHGSSLNPDDMALIWSAYRAGFKPFRGVEGFSNWFEDGGGLGPNGRLALPIMKYLVGYYHC